MRFACLPGCTACCRRRGFVYLTEEDLRRAAAHLGIGATEFEARYVYRTRNFLRLRKPRGAQCRFLAETGCRLHPDKPAQCRIFPFWPELIARTRAWRAAGRYCPGIGQGPLVKIEQARAAAAAMRAAYPAMYESRRCPDSR